jgi:glycosyltransferase involved in cell wall biosynthesis
MRPIIVSHLNNLCLGGTEYMLQMFLQYMKLIDDKYNHVLAFKAQNDRSREPFFREILGENKLIPYASIPEFIEILKEIQPSILHVYNAGIPEFPMISGIKDILPSTKMVQTAVFSNKNDQVDLDAIIHVSRPVSQIMGMGKDEKSLVIRNPVSPVETESDLRKELDISEDTFIFGHIGRPDSKTYSDVNIQAYKKIETDKTCFIILGVEEFAQEVFEKYEIKNYVLIPKTTDRNIINSFYKTINVLAHSRSDGECNPSVFFEAFSCGVPVISCYGKPYNGHIECTENAGMVVLNGDVEEYSRCMKHFLEMNEETYQYFSRNARKQWEKFAKPEDRAQELLNLYSSLIS